MNDGPTVLSTFSGVGGLDLGLARAGWRHVGFAEADEYRRAVLSERFPGVECADDVRRVVAPRRASLLAGGFPCQDLSVAGRRQGLAGERSGLFFEFARIAESLRPEWLLIENVPGLFSSNGGRDFGVLLGTLADLGYGVAWRILDSRFFGVPQRRRRVFIVAHDSGGRAGAERAGQVLAVGSGCDGHPAPRGEAGPGVAPGADDGVAGTLSRRYGKGINSTVDDGAVVVNALTKNGVSQPDDNAAQAGHLVPVGFHITQDPISLPGASLPLGHKSTGNGVHVGTSVRRLTPVECERLQGFPDGWTDVPWNGKSHAPDSRRYSALGDAVTVPVAEWIGRRIKEAG